MRAGLVRIEVGVAAQPLVNLAAEEIVDGLADRLADDVPKRHLDAGQDAHQRGVRPAGVAAAVDVAPQRLDPERVGAEDVALEHVADHRDDGVGREARGVDLADPLDAAGGPELEEDEIPSTESWRRIADDEGLEIGNLHRCPSLPRGRDTSAVPQNTITLRTAAPERDGGERLVDPFQRIAAGDQLVELQPSVAIERDDFRHVDRPDAPSPSSSPKSSVRPRRASPGRSSPGRQKAAFRPARPRRSASSATRPVRPRP